MPKTNYKSLVRVVMLLESNAVRGNWGGKNGLPKMERKILKLEING